MTETTETSSSTIQGGVTAPDLKKYLNVGCVVLQPEKIEDAIKNQDNTWSYLVHWKNVWLHESYCIKFSTLVDEYWLQNGGNPDSALIDIEAADGITESQNVVHESAGNEQQYAEIVGDQLQRDETNTESQHISPDETKVLSEQSDVDMTTGHSAVCGEVPNTQQLEVVSNIHASKDQTDNELILQQLSCEVGALNSTLNFVGSVNGTDNLSELIIATATQQVNNNMNTTNASMNVAENTNAAHDENQDNAHIHEEGDDAHNEEQQGDKAAKKTTPVECNICQKMLSSRNSLREHRITVHLKNGRFPCTECEKRFTNRRALEIHSVMHTSERNYVCDLCGSTHKRPRELQLHMRDMHSENQTYRCDVCFKCFKQKIHLKSHCFTEHEETVTDCIVCKQKLMTPFSIYTHCLKHAGYREFECEVCNRTYKTKKSLLDHQKIHSEDRKPFKECPKCGKAIFSRSHYYEHVNSHDVDSDAIVRYPCSICESTFLHTSSLKRHMLRHRSGGDLEHPKENPYLHMDESQLPSLCCRKCRRNYTSKSGYYDHIKRCRDGIVTKFQCELCSKFYTKRSALNRHVRTHHPEVYVAEFFDEQTTVEIVNSDQIETEDNEVLLHVQVALAPDMEDSEISEQYLEDNPEAIQAIEVVQSIQG